MDCSFASLGCISRYKKGAGRIYSESRGRGVADLSGGFAPGPPQDFQQCPPSIEIMLRGLG